LILTIITPSSLWKPCGSKRVSKSEYISLTNIVTKNSLPTSSLFEHLQNMNREQVASILASLARGTRLDVFLLLFEVGDEGITAGEVAERQNVVPSSLAHHLNELKATGMVDCVQNHRRIVYTARIPVMKDLASFPTRNCCGGRPEQCSPQWSGDERIEAMSGLTGDGVLFVFFSCAQGTKHEALSPSVSPTVWPLRNSEPTARRASLRAAFIHARWICCAT